MSTKKDCLDWTWESPSVLNVLYKSFHVGRNMSRFWSFPLISFRPNLAVSPLTNGLTLHEVQRPRRGEGGIIFSSLQWPLPADWACPFSPGWSESAGARTWALGPCKTHFCVPWSSVNTTAGNLLVGAAASLQPEPPTVMPAYWLYEEAIIYSFATGEIIQRFLWKRGSCWLSDRFKVHPRALSIPTDDCHHGDNFTLALQQSVLHCIASQIRFKHLTVVDLIISCVLPYL